MVIYKFYLKHFFYLNLKNCVFSYSFQSRDIEISEKKYTYG